MENYKDKINLGSEDRPELYDRLAISRNSSGYGYNLYDRKLKVQMLFGKTKEQCERGLSLLLNNEDFESFKDEIKDDEIVTNKILIVKDKYGDDVYLVPTLKELYKVSLHIVKQRIDNNYICKWDIPKDLDYTQEDIDKLPECFRKQAKEKLENNLKQIDEIKTNNREYDSIIKAIDTNDGFLAYSILRSRGNYQYENFEIIDPIIIEE